MKSIYYFIIILSLISSHVFGQSVVINEFMSDNETVIQDLDGNYQDWIELYNTSNSDINLLGYHLSDDHENINKWTFPQIIIPAHGFLVIFASGKNSLDITELHTNFKVSSSGEKIYLSNSSMLIIDQTVSISLFQDETYGRVPDGGEGWIKINTPSPGRSNNTSNQLLFSNQEGFYKDSIYQNISSFTGDTIYFTLNGKIPTEESSIYSNPILIDNRSSLPNVFSEIHTTPEKDLISYKAWESPNGLVHKATILRCASYRNGVRTSKVYTMSFLIDDDIFEKYSIPVISLVTEPNNLFNSDSGIYVPGKYYNPDDPEWSGNYFMHGKNWERPVHIEYFESNGKLGFSQDAGIRIHGGKTRQAAQKSLRLYARNEYGAKHFNYQLMPQKQNNEYKRFLLRTTMGSWGRQAIIRDIVAHDISRNLDIEYQDFQPVIVYLNGEYWGIHTIRDRIDERYIEYIHGIDKDSVELSETDGAHYESLIGFIETNDLADDVNYEYVKTQIDINNYIDYTISELFFANFDWPANNMKLWRPKTENGKWRWIFYDLDAGFGETDKNMLLHATKNDPSISWPNSPSSTFLFRSLLKNSGFSNQFISRYAEILNTDFSKDLIIRKLNAIEKIYEPEIPSHITRWNFPDSYSSWKHDIETEMYSFLQNRPCQVTKNILDFFNTTDFAFSCIIDDMIDNGLILAPNPNNGNFTLYNNSSDIINAQIILFHMSGTKVYENNNVSIMNSDFKYFNFRNVSRGTYILQIVSTDFNKRIKLVIH